MTPETNLSSDLRLALSDAIETSKICLRSKEACQSLHNTLYQISGQLDEPFVVAILGMVNEGKSSLVNALLERRLAATGAIETTATVNWFRFGKDDSIRCSFEHSGATQEVTPDYILSLQEESLASLRESSRIDRIDFFVNCDWLKDVAIVDTPGLGSVNDQHQDATSELAGLTAQLRNKNSQRSQYVAQKADAIVLLKSIATLSAQRDILLETRKLAGPNYRSFNTVVVLSRIDSIGELDSIEHRIQKERIDHSGLCNHFIAVSAGIDWLVRICRTDVVAFKCFFVELLELNEERFSECLDVLGEFRLLPNSSSLEAIPWQSLRVAAKFARERIQQDLPEQILERLEDLAGVKSLREYIVKRICPSGRLLRNYRIACDAERILKDVQFEIRRTEIQEHASKAKKIRDGLALLEQLSDAVNPMDKDRLKQLRELLTVELTPSQSNDVSSLLDRSITKFSALRRELEWSAENVQLQQLLIDNRTSFSESEFEELRILFERHPKANSGDTAETATIAARQSYWLSKGSDHPVQRQIHRAAATRYGSQLFHLSKSEIL